MKIKEKSKSKYVHMFTFTKLLMYNAICFVLNNVILHIVKRWYYTKLWVLNITKIKLAMAVGCESGYFRQPKYVHGHVMKNTFPISYKHYLLRIWLDSSELYQSEN